jgi:stage III sporulation protein AG
MVYEPHEDTAKKAAKAMKKSGKLAIALGGIVLGALLLIFGNRGGDGNGDKDSDTILPNAPAQSVETLRAELEGRVVTLCSRVSGVGSVTATVALDGGYSYEYATDRKGESTYYVTVGSGSDQSLVFITERPPAIIGIGVVCEGGNDPTVRQELVSLLSAAFGVGSNKIYVTGMG